MYKELLDIVRNGDQPEEEAGSTSTDMTEPRTTAADQYASNMPVVVEESETEFPSFSAKKKNNQ